MKKPSFKQPIRKVITGIVTKAYDDFLGGNKSVSINLDVILTFNNGEAQAMFNLELPADKFSNEDVLDIFKNKKTLSGFIVKQIFAAIEQYNKITLTDFEKIKMKKALAKISICIETDPLIDVLFIPKWFWDCSGKLFFDNGIMK